MEIRPAIKTANKIEERPMQTKYNHLARPSVVWDIGWKSFIYLLFFTLVVMNIILSLNNKPILNLGIIR